MWMKKLVWGFLCPFFLFAAITVQTVSKVCPVYAAPQDNNDGISETSEIIVRDPVLEDGPDEEDFEPAKKISLYATAAVLLDGDSGRVLYGKNADTPMAMASTTKIMTCILVLENGSLDEVLTVSAYAASMPQVKLNIRKGEEYTVKDLLYSLMLESHNDSAAALAEHVGRKYLSEELKSKPASDYTLDESRQAVAAFAALMNEKAKELGCTDTWFITPNGLDATEEVTLEDGSVVQKEHCTTAAELARIMAYCIRESPQKEGFLTITRTASYSFYANRRSFSCMNHNAFLTMMDGALSGKTGFTNKAGYCYVGALESEGRIFIVALLACGWPNNKTYKWSDTRELMQYGIDNFFYKSFEDEDIAFDESRLSPILVLEGQSQILGENVYTNVAVGESGISGEKDPMERTQVLLRTDEQIQVTYTVEKQLTAPVEGGTQVGKIEYSINSVVYKEDPIVTTDAVERIDLRWCVFQILERFFLKSEN